jgi:hypothetical protein
MKSSDIYLKDAYLLWCDFRLQCERFFYEYSTNGFCIHDDDHLPEFALKLWDDFTSHGTFNSTFNFGPSEFIEFIPGQIEGPQLNFIDESMKVFALTSETVSRGKPSVKKCDC